jgi:small subunit ribosomal protein S6
MRIYEELFIVRPDATDEEIDPLIEQLTTLITGQGGSMIKTDKWGVRKLAYRVQKRNEGYYILLQFNGQPETVRELERRLRVADMVIKFITVRIDEKLKKIEKRRKEREKRASRKPAPQVAQPSMPSDPGAAMPGAPGAAGPTPGAPMPGAPVTPAAVAPAAAPAPAAPVLTPVGAEKE